MSDESGRHFYPNARMQDDATGPVVRMDYLIPGAVIDIADDGTVIRRPDGNFIQHDPPKDNAN